MSIADTGRFWEILVIPVYQILEDSEKYWLYQYCRYEKISYEVAECTCIIYCLFCPVCASVMRGRTVYRETGRKKTRGGRKEKRGRKKREGRKVKRGGRDEKRGGRKEKRGGRMDKRIPCPPPLLWYNVFAANS